MNGSMSAQKNQGWSLLSEDNKSSKTHTLPPPFSPYPFFPFPLIFYLWLSVKHIPGRKGILISPNSEISKMHNQKQGELWRKQTWLYPDSAALPINIECTFRQASAPETEWCNTDRQLLHTAMQPDSCDL